MADLIDSVHHIELDGVKYRLAESTEGAHHDVRGEPLRPPNAVTIQGENSQKFQPRPDTLVWSWTDWSTGEGQMKLQFGQAGRSWQLNGVRAFEEPGHLIPGYYVEVTQDSTGAADFAQSLLLCILGSTLIGWDQVNDEIYTWDDANGKWGTNFNITAWTLGTLVGATGSAALAYGVESGTGTLFSWDGSAQPVSVSAGLITASSTLHIAQLGPYVYVYDSVTGNLWEVAKTGAFGILVDQPLETGLSLVPGAAALAVLDGRVYVMSSRLDDTSVREITPTTAAGEGYGTEVARIGGFRGEAIWSHAGSIFVMGKFQDVDSNRTIMYLTPGQQYGTLGEVRNNETMGQGAGGTARMLDHFWVQTQLDGANPKNALMQIDSVSGGISCLGYAEDSTGVGDVSRPISWKGDIFWSLASGAGTKRVLRARTDQYMKLSNAISSEHDFDLASAKYLGSMVLSCQALPADWTIYVDYQIDGDGTWTNGITYSTTSGNGTTVPITTDTATVEFNTLQMRVRFVYGGAGVPTSAPVVLGIEARAAVATKVNVFNYQIDLSDDHLGGGQSRAGASKASTFLVTAKKATAIDLKDGYMNRHVGEYDQYDVTVDEFDVVLDRPGEGIGIIKLREVV